MNLHVFRIEFLDWSQESRKSKISSWRKKILIQISLHYSVNSSIYNKNKFDAAAYTR